VEGANNRLYTATHHLTVRPRSRSGTIARVTPDTATSADDMAIEISGSRFSKMVNVIWVSAGGYHLFEHSADRRTQRGEDSVVVPFAARVRGADPGDYLLVVENEDRTAAIYDDFFLVSPAYEAEIEEVEVVRLQNEVVLTVHGFNLDSIDKALLDAPAGRLPLRVVHYEGGLTSALNVILPPGSGDHLPRVSSFLVDGSRLVITLGERGRLTIGATRESD